MTILELIEALKNQPELSNYNWTTPPDLKHGVLTTNQAFIEAKKQGKAPLQIATEIAQQINQIAKQNDWPIQAHTAGPYVNIDLTYRAYANQLSKLSTDNSEPLQKDLQRKVILEYVSPNVAKPLHAGHVRNANIGEALRRILSLKYKNIITDNHWADWGVQFGILLWGWKQFEIHKTLQLTMNEKPVQVSFNEYDDNPLHTLVKVYIWANQQKDHVENWEQIVRDEFLQLEQGNKRNLELSREFVEISKSETKKDLDLLNVKDFDYEYGESYYLPEAKELQSFLDEKSLWQKEGAARYFDFEDLAEKFEGLDNVTKNHIKALGRCYLISSNGYSTYAFRDVAARINWARHFQTDLMITITGNEQTHHFKQFFAITAYLASLPQFKEKYGVEVSERLHLHNLKHIAYGFLTLPDGKMSTRKGNIFTARDLIEQIIEEAKAVLIEKNSTTQDIDQQSLKVGIAALKWFDLNRDSTADIVLNMSQVLSFEGNTGVYQLYTLARINSILQKNQAEHISSAHVEKLNDNEILIMKTIYQFPKVLDEITSNYKPHLLCTHLYDLATQFNSWYAKYSVSNEQDLERKQTLLRMCQLLQHHIKFGLELLAIEPVDSL